MRRCWTLSFAESVKKLIAVLQKKICFSKGEFNDNIKHFCGFQNFASVNEKRPQI